MIARKTLATAALALACLTYPAIVLATLAALLAPAVVRGGAA